MNDTAPKPRRRWRWLKVGFVLFAISVASFWYWPRGDARLVGHWAWYVDGDPQPKGMITLARNGWFTWERMNSTSLSGPWQLRDGRLCLGRITDDPGPLLQGLIGTSTGSLRRYANIDLMFLEGLDVNVVDVTPNAIRLRNTKFGGECSMVRRTE